MQSPYTVGLAPSIVDGSARSQRQTHNGIGAIQDGNDAGRHMWGAAGGCRGINRQLLRGLPCDGSENPAELHTTFPIKALPSLRTRFPNGFEPSCQMLHRGCHPRVR